MASRPTTPPALPALARSNFALLRTMVAAASRRPWQLPTVEPKEPRRPTTCATCSRIRDRPPLQPTPPQGLAPCHKSGKTQGQSAESLDAWDRCTAVILRLRFAWF